MPTFSMKVVETESLTKIYHFGDVEVTALNNVNLAIEEHEFVAVWGPSGSGKSTFCNVIGLLDTPTQGDVRIKEDSVAKLSDKKRSEIRNEYIGFVFQNFNLVPVLSALENVMLPLQILGVSTRQAKEKARALLEEVGLEDRMNHRPQKLSGGQQQRVAIARALVTDPLLVIADEPTANLDTESANLIVNLMRKINEERGAAFVFSTHDDRLLDRVDRKIHLQDGAVKEDVRVEGDQPSQDPAATIPHTDKLTPAPQPTAQPATTEPVTSPPSPPLLEPAAIPQPIPAQVPTPKPAPSATPVFNPPPAPPPSPPIDPS